MPQFTVQPPEEALTLASYLRRHLPGLSWTTARQHVHARRVSVNATICVDDARRLRAGDIVELRDQSATPLPGAHSIKIVFEDDAILVIDKPPGMECERRSEEKSWSPQRKLRNPTVVEALTALGKPVRPVHRLDRDTSGLMLYAKTPQAQRALIEQLSRHQVQRTYLALAIGAVSTQTIHNWIIRDRGDGLRGVVPHPQPGAQEAITHIKAIRQIPGHRTLCECSLETGRTHQIRIHLASIAHPLSGEKLYRRPSPTAPQIPDPSPPPRHALHSHSLSFLHPLTHRPLRFSSPLPPDLSF